MTDPTPEEPAASPERRERNSRNGPKAAPNGRPTRGNPVHALVRTRRSQFMIASRQAPGVTPMSSNDIVNVLQNMPDVEIVKRIEAPRLLGLQAFGGGVAGVVVANIEDQKAELLSTSGRGQVIVERDQFLNFALEPSLVAPLVPNPGVFMASATGFEATFEVHGPNGPLAGAEVHLFGSMFPARGLTDQNGRVTITVAGEPPELMRALYVKPKADHWDFWLRDPVIAPGTSNEIMLRPLDMPASQDGRPYGWGQKAMGLDQVPAGFDGRGVKVAVIDSGAAQTTHRNLGNLGPGVSLIGGDSAAWTVDEIGHGTHCAGVIAASGAGGILGFAPKAEIHIARVFPGGRFSDLIGALDYCMEQGIDVASMSLGGGTGSQILADRIAQARSLGMACVVAAGNSASPVQFPAFLPTTLAVAAIGRFGVFPADSFHAEQVLAGFQGRNGYFPASFSCFGPEIDVCAPGVAILSAVPDDGFASWDGTSMATPHVAGLAALVLAHHPDFAGTFAARNNARVDRLFDLIRASCQPLPFGAERVGRGLPWAPSALGLAGSTHSTATGGGGAVPPESVAALMRLIQMLQRAG